MRNKSIGVFFEPTKTTSGQRFYRDLCGLLQNISIPIDQKPHVVLFNISAPVTEILKAKLRGQKVVLRVDGLWWDRISPEFLEKFWWPIRLIFRIGAHFKKLRNVISDIANLFDDNYTGFFRIALADHIIYQSFFCKIVHQKYFPKKNYSIIVNGSRLQSLNPNNIRFETGPVKMCVIYSEAPAKGIYEMIQFVKWVNEVKNMPAKLYIIGFNGKVPKYAPNDMFSLITNSEFVITHPHFDDIDAEVTKVLSEMHCCLCFSFRDPCPNAVVESMAHHLPVVGIASGGVPEIVRDAGELIDWDDWKDGFFSPHRYEYQVKEIDFEQMFLALTKVLDDLVKYRAKVRQRFLDDIDTVICAERYGQVLQRIAHGEKPKILHL